MTNATPAIEVDGISKGFRTNMALRGVEITVESGEVFALLGPNGAGKTTLVRILTTLIRPDAGHARVCGLDVVTQAPEVRQVIGLTGQFAAVDMLLTGRENLEMAAALSHVSRREIPARVSELLDQFELGEVAGRQARTYSGGMRRRLDLAASLIARPRVLILDEPTTGLDPRSRSQVWSTVEALAAEGTSVLLTTQYLEEADRLATSAAVLNHGRVIASGTTQQLKAQTGVAGLEIYLADLGSFERALSKFCLKGNWRQPSTEGRCLITMSAPDGVGLLRSILEEFEGAQITIDDVGLRRPSLDEAFLALTNDLEDASSGAELVDNDAEITQESANSSPVAGVGPVQRELLSPKEMATGSTLISNDIRPALSRQVRLASAVRDIRTITGRNVRRIRRTPRLLLVSSIQPVLFVLTFRYVFGGSLHVPGMSYIDYLLPGTLVTATLMGATTAVAMATDLAGGMIDRFKSLPIARSAVLAGRCTADLVRTVLVIAVVLAAGLIAGFRFETPPAANLAALGLAVATGFSFIWLYALIGLIARDPETAQLGGVLTMMPLLFGSSVFVRVQTLPGWLQVFARYQPVTVTVDAVRALCEGGPTLHLVVGAAAWIIGLVGACGLFSVAIYRRS